MPAHKSNRKTTQCNTTSASFWHAMHAQRPMVDCGSTSIIRTSQICGRRGGVRGPRCIRGFGGGGPVGSGIRGGGSVSREILELGLSLPMPFGRYSCRRWRVECGIRSEDIVAWGIEHVSSWAWKGKDKVILYSTPAVEMEECGFEVCLCLHGGL